MDELISRQAAIDALEEPPKVPDTWSDESAIGEREQWEKDVKALNSLPSAQPEIVRCKDCKWWEKKEDSTLGYCNAVKHWHFSDHLEIQIYSRYEPDFFCADGERRSENE